MEIATGSHLSYSDSDALAAVNATTSITTTCDSPNTDIDVNVANLEDRLGDLTSNTVTVGVDSDTDVKFNGQIQIGQSAGWFNMPTVTQALGYIVWCWTEGNKQHIVLTSGANFITFDTWHPPHKGNYTLKVTQPASGAGGTISTWSATGAGNNIKWAGGAAPVLSTANDAIDIVSFYFDGTDYFGVASLNFSL